MVEQVYIFVISFFFLCSMHIHIISHFSGMKKQENMTTWTEMLYLTQMQFQTWHTLSHFTPLHSTHRDRVKLELLWKEQRKRMSNDFYWKAQRWLRVQSMSSIYNREPTKCTDQRNDICDKNVSMNCALYHINNHSSWIEVHIIFCFVLAHFPVKCLADYLAWHSYR